jgi:hypothetical protein
MLISKGPPYITLSGCVRIIEAAILKIIEQIHNKIKNMKKNGVIERIGPITDPLRV